MERVGLWGLLCLGAAVVGAIGAGAATAGCSDDEGESEPGFPVDAGTDGPIVRDGGGTPAEPPDGVSLCPTGVCNYQSGQGCPAALPACVPTLNPEGQPAPTCIATTGTGQSGSACDAQDDCAPGYLCAETECRKLCCSGDWTGCPSENEHCIQGLKLASGSEAIETGAMLCYPVNTCDALDPASCTKAGSTCQIVDPTGATACFVEGTGAEGEACPCKGGYLCADLGDDKVCRKLCAAVEGGGEPGCAAGQACVHYNDKHPENVGECVDLE